MCLISVLYLISRIAVHGLLQLVSNTQIGGKLGALPP
jgi:hypothetical protein